MGQIAMMGEDSKYVSYFCKLWTCITGTWHLVGANLRQLSYSSFRRSVIIRYQKLIDPTWMARWRLARWRLFEVRK